MFRSLRYFAALLCLCPLFGQAPVSVQVTQINNLTSLNQVIDNRSIQRQCDTITFTATGTGSWSVQAEYADIANTGPWSAFAGSSATIVSTSAVPNGIASGYHPFFRFHTTAGTTVVNMSCTNDFYLASGNYGTVFSVAASVPSWLSVSVTNPTSNPVIAITAAGNQTSHQVIGTCGTAASFAPCSLTAADLPATVLIGPGSSTAGFIPKWLDTSGHILSAGVAAPTGAIVGDIDAQNLTNKTYGGTSANLASTATAINSVTLKSDIVGVTTGALSYQSGITGSIDGLDPRTMWLTYLGPGCLVSGGVCSRNVGVNGVSDAPAGSLADETVGIYGGVTNAATSGTAVGGSFEAYASGSGTSSLFVNLEGINTLVVDNNPTTGAVYGFVKEVNEFDFNATSPTTQIIAVSIGGGSHVQPASAIGFTCNGLGDAGIIWDSCFYTLDGVARVGLSLLAQGTGASQQSQEIHQYAHDSSGGLITYNFLGDSVGNYLAIAPASYTFRINGIQSTQVTQNGLTLTTNKGIAWGGVSFANLGANLAVNVLGLCTNCTPNTNPCTIGTHSTLVLNDGGVFRCY